MVMFFNAHKIKTFNVYPKGNLLTFFNKTKIHLQSDGTCRVIFLYRETSKKLS